MDRSAFYPNIARSAVEEVVAGSPWTVSEMVAERLQPLAVASRSVSEGPEQRPGGTVIWIDGENTPQCLPRRVGLLELCKNPSKIEKENRVVWKMDETGFKVTARVVQLALAHRRLASGVEKGDVARGVPECVFQECIRFLHVASFATEQQCVCQSGGCPDADGRVPQGRAVRSHGVVASARGRPLPRHPQVPPVSQ